ncbi:unnamed protein product, partial [Adineta steineri]
CLKEQFRQLRNQFETNKNATSQQIQHLSSIHQQLREEYEAYKQLAEEQVKQIIIKNYEFQEKFEPNNKPTNERINQIEQSVQSCKQGSDGKIQDLIDTLEKYKKADIRCYCGGHFCRTCAGCSDWKRDGNNWKRVGNGCHLSHSSSSVHNQSIKATTSFTTLLEQLSSNANVQLPYILPYENTGRKNVTTKYDLTRAVVTIAHLIPLKNEVIVASGFAVLDGGLIVTCAHTFYQAARHLSCSELDQKSQSIVITDEGELIPVATVESHLVRSDIVLLRLQGGRQIPSLAVDPYPAPKSTSLLSYNFVAASLTSTSRPTVSYSWKPAEVLFYKGPCGQEAATGTYDELSAMMYSHPPSNGSSGGPIVNEETKSVVGIIRGSEVNYATRKSIGFATPSECLFEAFKLPGMPDGLE